VFRLWFYNGFSMRSSRSDGDRRGGGAVVAILIAVALIAVAYFLSILIRLALSRSGNSSPMPARSSSPRIPTP